MDDCGCIAVALARPHVVGQDLSAGYVAMAAVQGATAEAVVAERGWLV